VEIFSLVEAAQYATRELEERRNDSKLTGKWPKEVRFFDKKVIYDRVCLGKVRVILLMSARKPAHITPFSLHCG